VTRAYVGFFRGTPLFVQILLVHFALMPMLVQPEGGLLLSGEAAREFRQNHGAFFSGALALTLIFVWVAHRNRYRPSALVLGVLLVMTLTSFHPVQQPDPLRVADVRPRTRLGGVRPSYKYDVDVPQPQVEVPEPPEVPDVDVPVDPVEVYIPRDFVERIPDWSRDAMESAERMARDNEHVREMMREIRMRIREEARRQHWRQMIAERRARAKEFALTDSP